MFRAVYNRNINQNYVNNRRDKGANRVATNQYRIY